MGNNPVGIVDPDGKFGLGAFLITGAALIYNTVKGAEAGYTGLQMMGSWGTTIAASGVGSTAAGAVGNGIGFYGGAVSGGAGAAAGGLVSGAGHAWVGGASFGQGLGAGLKAGGVGAVTGGVIGGIFGGINAVRHGGDFWSGEGATFASYASAEPIAGEKVKYSTKSAREFSEKFKELEYYDDVKLYADGTTGSKLYGTRGKWFIENATQRKVYALHQYLGFGKGSSIHFASASFTSSRQLYLIMGHEYLHAGYYLGYKNAYNHGNVDKQHAAIYRWEQEVSRRWGNWPTGTETHQWKHLYDSSYNYEKFFNISIPWID